MGLFKKKEKKPEEKGEVKKAKLYGDPLIILE